MFKVVVSNLVTSGASSNDPKSTSMGEYTMGSTFEATAYPYINRDQEDLSLINPSEGTFKTPELAGIVKNTPAGGNAKKPLDALLSQYVQMSFKGSIPSSKPN